MPENLSETYTVHDMDNNEKILNQLIELYFEGMTTLEQERQLRSMLADGRFRSREADEARAVLGVSAILRSHGTVRQRHSPNVLPMWVPNWCRTPTRCWV